PTKIVSVKSKPDPTVTNGISCMFCHSRGMIDKSDQVRDHAAKNAGAFSAEESRTIRALYPPDKEFKDLLQQDAERFRRAVAATGKAPKQALPYVQRGTAYFDKGDYAQAISDYNSAIALDPRNSGAWNYRGMAHANRAAYEQAIADYSEALRLDPRLAEVYYN